MIKVNYVTTSDLGNIIDQWIKDNPHNNGYAYRWIVENPKDSAYPEVDKYFVDKGIQIGETIVIHSVW
jgi:hypothetical protein